MPVYANATSLDLLTLPLVEREDVSDLDLFKEEAGAAYLNEDMLYLRQFGYISCAGDSGTGWTALVNGERKLVGVHKAGDFCVSLAVGTPIGAYLEWIRATIDN